MIRTCTKANSQKMEYRELRKERKKVGEDDGGGKGGEKEGDEKGKGEPAMEWAVN